MISAAPRDGAVFIGALCAWLDRTGAALYDQGVTQLGHGLQSAHLAEQQGAQAAEIVACLLHDMGHLLLDEHRGRIDFLAVDRKHEAIGAAWLLQAFGAPVADPVRHHVAAKRYLCAVDRPYWTALSEASRRSLALQGGPMTPDEAAAFAALPRADAAIRLRRRDDAAKQRDLRVPGLDHYRGLMLGLLAGG